jgi:hypothetical protein
MFLEKGFNMAINSTQIIAKLYNWINEKYPFTINSTPALLLNEAAKKAQSLCLYDDIGSTETDIDIDGTSRVDFRFRIESKDTAESAVDRLNISKCLEDFRVWFDAQSRSGLLTLTLGDDIIPLEIQIVSLPTQVYADDQNNKVWVAVWSLTYEIRR